MIQEDAWCDFSFLDFVKACFVSCSVVCLSIWSMCVLEVCVFCFFGVKCSINIIKFIWSGVLFNAPITLLIFYLEDLSIADGGVLKSPTMTVLLSIPFLKSSQIFFIFRFSCIGCLYVYKGYILLLDWPLKYYVMTFFVSCYGHCFEVYFVW